MNIARAGWADETGFEEGPGDGLVDLALEGDESFATVAVYLDSERLSGAVQTLRLLVDRMLAEGLVVGVLTTHAHGATMSVACIINNLARVDRPFHSRIVTIVGEIASGQTTSTVLDTPITVASYMFSDRDVNPRTVHPSTQSVDKK
jgi:hypothetical protein